MIEGYGASIKAWPVAVMWPGVVGLWPDTCRGLWERLNLHPEQWVPSDPCGHRRGRP